MKIFIQSLLLCLCISSTNAQLILDFSNTPHSNSYQDIRHFVNGSIPLPSKGAAQIYNYSSLNSQQSDTIPYLPATRGGFTTSTRFNYGSFPLAGIPLYSEYYTELTASGIVKNGSYKLEQKVPLQSISGVATDTLAFPGNPSYFNHPVPELPFPTTYGDQWSSTYTYKVNFLLSVSAFGLNNTPGAFKQRIMQTDSVIGYGQLTIPTAKGDSKPYEVLLIKQSRISIDSVFLNGLGAPTALLSAFGLSQGGSIALNQYAFFAAGFERPLLLIEMSSDWSTAQRCYYASQNVMTVGTNEFPETGEPQVFPNPIQAGHTLTFALESPFSAYHLILTNSSGLRVLETSQLTKENGQISWKLPENLKAGIYYYSAYGYAGDHRSGKILVR